MPVRAERRFKSSPKKHPTYFFSDGDIVIRVGNSLFKVHVIVLHEHSEVFRETIMPPTLNGKPLKLGFDEQCPFVLKEESEVDFERLLSVLYPSKSPLCRVREADEWISILRLARKYDIEDIIPMATGHLDSMSLDPFRKILIWEEYRLDSSLLLSAYVQICQRTEPLTLVMAKMLGLEIFTKIAAARDLYYQRLGCVSCKKQGRAKKQALAQEIVSQVFFNQIGM